MKLGNNKWLNADIHTRIEPPNPPLIKATNGNTEETNIIKIKMRQDPVSSTSDTYKLNFQTLENVKPEEFLQTTKDFKTAIDRIGNTSATVQNQFLRTILRRESLR